MRKLILQVQITIDGYIADKDSTTEFAFWNWSEDWTWDPPLRKYHIDLTASADTILLGRKMAPSFLEHWKMMEPKHDNPQSEFAASINKAQKVIFTKTLDKSTWENTVLAKGDLTEEVNKLKGAPGTNILVYGGASFDAALIEAGLIDEFHFIVNPAALGAGLAIFNGPINLVFKSSTAYPCGVVVSQYLKR